VDRLVKEAIEVSLNKNTFIRDDGLIVSQARPLTTARVMKVKAGSSRACTLLRPPTLSSRYIMTWADLGGSQFPDDGDRDSLQNVGLLAIQPPDAADRPRRFYWMLLSIRNSELMIPARDCYEIRYCGFFSTVGWVILSRRFEKWYRLLLDGHESIQGSITLRKKAIIP
jgi:hypothetical protein